MSIQVGFRCWKLYENVRGSFFFCIGVEGFCIEWLLDGYWMASERTAWMMVRGVIVEFVAWYTSNVGVFGRDSSVREGSFVTGSRRNDAEGIWRRCDGERLDGEYAGSGVRDGRGRWSLDRAV